MPMSSSSRLSINMYQSAPRKNFLDTLADPTTIALLGSIALHALIGSSLPLFNHLDKDSKKADPGTVKVVELTPSELQRIPQAPPTPTPQVFTAPPTVPSNKVVVPPISPNSPTVPFSPIRIPLEQTTPKPPKGLKDQQAIPQPQPTEPIFDPEISLKPTPKSSQSPTPDKLKPAPKPSPTPIVTKPKVTTPISGNKAPTDDDGGDFQPVTPTTTPSPQAQSTNPTRPAGGSSQTKPAGQPSGQSSGGSPAGSGNNFPYTNGKFDAVVQERLAKYKKAYPGLKVYLPRLVQRAYPADVLCANVRKTPFIVMMVAFDKVPENRENNPLGYSSAPSIDEPFVAADQDTAANQMLATIAVDTAITEATEADKVRPLTDRGSRVLYQYRVQYDPTTCKK
jgi:hypothetical protein